MIYKPDQVLKQVIHACAEASEKYDSNEKNVPNAIFFTVPNFNRNITISSRVKKKIRSGKNNAPLCARKVND